MAELLLIIRDVTGFKIGYYYSMSSKVIYLFIFIGSIVGGYIPTLFGVSSFSYTSVLFSGIGGVIGLWIGYKLSN